MQETIKPAAHKLIMGERSNLSMTGISDVKAFDANEIILKTEYGELLIRGVDLHMSRLSLDQGEVNVDGTIDSLTYLAKGRSEKNQGHLFDRLFQ